MKKLQLPAEAQTELDVEATQRTTLINYTVLQKDI